MRLCTSCRRLLRPEAVRCPHDGSAFEEVESLPPGTKLGVYRVDKMLGEGGMGFVYAATHEVLNRRSAIKMLRPELAGNEQIVTRFLNEAKAVNLIDHPNIVNVYDYGDGDDGSVYFVMEFLEGETLDDMMRKRQAMAIPLFLHLFTQIAKALAAAHAKHIVHRDLKPANIFVVPREDNPAFVKLLDFGIAQLRGAGAVQGLTVMGSVMGTPQYMSPEQVTGGAVDARTDVWAMGVMMYRAVSGQAPFKGEEFADLAGKILYSEPQQVGELVQIPPSLAKLIMSCMERRLEARCQSIAELLTALERVKQDCRLDDEAVIYAAAADVEAHVGAEIGADGRPVTRKSIAGSLPRFQGAGVGYVAPGRVGAVAAGGKAAGGKGSGKGMKLAAAGAAVAALAVGAVLVLGGGKSKGAESPPVPATTPATTPAALADAKAGGSETEQAPPPPLAELVKSGKIDEAKKLAGELLMATMLDKSPQKQGLLVDALAMVRRPETMPLLVIALEGGPEVRKKAANALAELRLPDAAKKIQAVFDASGGDSRVKLDLAAAMFRLGNESGKNVLLDALNDPTRAVAAAAALAERREDSGRKVLSAALEDLQPSSESWRKAAGALARMGDAKAKARLEQELAGDKEAIAVAAAEQLGRAGDKNAVDYLARVTADEGFGKREQAALALARLDDKRALAWVVTGLGSESADERRHAVAVAGTLATAAADHLPGIAAMATDDADSQVRMTALVALLCMGGSR